MPMTILFFCFVAIVFLHELEVSLKNAGRIDWGGAIRFPVARTSRATVVGVLVLGILFALEVKLYLSGRIYAGDQAFSPAIRAALITLLCALAVAYRAACLSEKASPSDIGKTRIGKRLIFMASVLVLVAFLSMQFKLIIG